MDAPCSTPSDLTSEVTTEIRRSVSAEGCAPIVFEKTISASDPTTSVVVIGGKNDFRIGIKIQCVFEGTERGCQVMPPFSVSVTINVPEDEAVRTNT